MSLLAVFTHTAGAGNEFADKNVTYCPRGLNRHTKYVLQIYYKYIYEKSTVQLTSVGLTHACPNNRILLATSHVIEMPKCRGFNLPILGYDN